MPKLRKTVMEERRAAILAAARRCFAEKGFEETSIDQICERAGISKGALYGYFKSKEELIWAVAEAQGARIGALSPPASPESLLDQLEQLLEPRGDGLHAARLEVYAVARCFVDAALRERYLANRALLLEWLGRGFASGENSVDSKAAARIVDAYLSGTLLIQAVDDRETGDADLRTLLLLLAGTGRAD